ncbi:hypothetical protein U1Q18_049111 [Sarracenia purpurea var. burkii]
MVLLGDLNITAKNDDAKPAVYRIVRVHDHPNYKPPLYYNDISLFELNASVTMSPYVRPACLHTSTANLFNVKGSITGWGAVGHGYRRSDHLLKATISVMDDQRCQESYEKTDTRLTRGFETTTMICAGDYAGVNDTCSGDSGGPLQMLVDKQACMWSIFGVTSFGKICGNFEEPEPGVYTKVAYYLDWIQSIVLALKAIGAAVPTLSNLELETIASVFGEEGYSAEKASDLLVQCECVLLFSCQVEDVVLWPITDDDNDQGQCPDPYICCKIQNTESPSPTSPLPQENSTIFSLDPNEGVKEMTTNGPSIGDEIIDQKCECVLLNQCDPQNIVNLSATNFSQ